MRLTYLLCLILLLFACNEQSVEDNVASKESNLSETNVADDEGAADIEQDDATEDEEDQYEPHPDDIEWDVDEWDVDEHEAYEFLENEEIAMNDSIAYTAEELVAFLENVRASLLSYDALSSYVIHKINQREQTNEVELITDTLTILDGAATGDFATSRARYLQSINVREYKIEREGLYNRDDEFFYTNSNENNRWLALYVDEEPFMYYTPLQLLDIVARLLEGSYTEIKGNQLTVGLFLDPVADADIITKLTQYDIERELPYIAGAREELKRSDYIQYQQMTIILNFDLEKKVLDHFMFELIAGHGEELDLESDLSHPWHAKFSQQFDYESYVPLNNLEVTDDIRAEAFAG